MTVQEMHFEFKRRLDKVDMAGNRNLRPEFIDSLLNSAVSVYIKRLVAPVHSKFLYGFEVSQRVIDSLYTLVKEDIPVTIMSYNDDIYQCALPIDYMFHVKTDVMCKDDVCDNDVRCIVKIRQHADNFRLSEFDKSNLMFRFVNGTFVGQLETNLPGRYLNIYADFTIDDVLMTYIRRPARISIAGDIGGYTLPDGTVLTTNQDCDLPKVAHDEIVNLAVLLAKDEIEMPTIQYTMVEQQQMEN